MEGEGRREGGGGKEKDSIIYCTGLCSHRLNVNRVFWGVC